MDTGKPTIVLVDDSQAMREFFEQVAGEMGFELLVYDRDLGDEERRSVSSYLKLKYGLPETKAAETEDRFDLAPEVLALVSLCHVLLNSNEFVYVD